MSTILSQRPEPGERRNPEMTPIRITHADLKAMRDAGNLTPGQLYRITDFVTTVNTITRPYARSAGHPFDILVRADSVSTLNEQAWAVRHEGDTYFQDARLEAWQLNYRLDNVQWSKQAGTYVTDEENGYTFLVVGDITLSGHTYKLLQGFGMYVEDWSDYALMETVAEGEQIFCYYGDPEEFDPEEPEVVGTASGVEEVTESGRGTITWMKDEHGNECPYDFKNIQYKRYMATDSVSGRDGLGGKYMVADPDNCPQGLSVEDTEDYIWAYTFSSDNAGGEQTDYSLTAEHQVHDNVMKPYSGGLSNNVMFGDGIYGNEFEVECYGNSFGSDFSSNSIGSDFLCNSIGSDFLRNSIDSYFRYNSIGLDFSSNSIGSNFKNNSIGSNFQNNSIGSNMYGNSIGSNFQNNSIGSYFRYNSIGSNFQNNSIGSNMYGNSIGSIFTDNTIGSFFQSNSIGSNYQYNTVDEGVQHTTTGDKIKYVHVLNGVAGTSSSKLTLTFAANKTYCQMAAKTTAGVLKIWVPADLV